MARIISLTKFSADRQATVPSGRATREAALHSLSERLPAIPERSQEELHGIPGLPLSTAANRRSRGIGEQLVQWAVAEARAKGCKLVELLTHHTRVDAQRFYERLGFARRHVGMTLRF